ncbi:DUF1660 family phage protein [Gilvibacter sp.]|uniref:DUF1660 family phage protein n=1 Tax=Gilvibacter sp. TaxID=2729997 RepID=UPI003452AE1C|nr:hypothetical protein [Gilvibacter sp.]
MKSTSAKTSSFGQLKCKLFGHKLVLKQKVTDSVSEYCCSHCNEEFSTNPQGKLERLTNKTREINECLRDLFTRRSKHRLPNVTP